MRCLALCWKEASWLPSFLYFFLTPRSCLFFLLSALCLIPLTQISAGSYVLVTILAVSFSLCLSNAFMDTMKSWAFYLSWALRTLSNVHFIPNPAWPHWQFLSGFYPSLPNLGPGSLFQPHSYQYYVFTLIPCYNYPAEILNVGQPRHSLISF